MRNRNRRHNYVVPHQTRDETIGELVQLITAMRQTTSTLPSDADVAALQQHIQALINHEELRYVVRSMKPAREKEQAAKLAIEKRFGGSIASGLFFLIEHGIYKSLDVSLIQYCLTHNMNWPVYYLSSRLYDMNKYPILFEQLKEQKYPIVAAKVISYLRFELKLDDDEMGEFLGFTMKSEDLKTFAEKLLSASLLTKANALTLLANQDVYLNRFVMDYFCFYRKTYWHNDGVQYEKIKRYLSPHLMTQGVFDAVLSLWKGYQSRWKPRGLMLKYQFRQLVRADAQRTKQQIQHRKSSQVTQFRLDEDSQAAIASLMVKYKDLIPLDPYASEEDKIKLLINISEIRMFRTLTKPRAIWAVMQLCAEPHDVVDEKFGFSVPQIVYLSRLESIDWGSIHLPAGISSWEDRLLQIADQYNIQPRGTVLSQLAHIKPKIDPAYVASQLLLPFVPRPEQDVRQKVQSYAMISKQLLEVGRVIRDLRKENAELKAENTVLKRYGRVSEPMEVSQESAAGVLGM